ncbi:hypothetical protein FI667_g8087, partial [Globisporangium splendens]
MPSDPQDAMRPLVLTPEEQLAIAEEAERVIAETLATNELFIASGRKLPRHEWKRLKSKESLHVYRSRRTDPSESVDGDDEEEEEEESFSSTSSSSALPATGSNPSNPSISSSSTSSDRSDSNTVRSVIGIMKPTDTPLVIATGIIPGTVEDAVFGSQGHTEQLWRFRDVHTNDQDDGMKILATILSPTPEDPLKSLSLKWVLNNINPLSRARDAVYIEATGMARDARGEPFGYYLVHSLDKIARIPGLGHLSIVRAQVSTCCICRPNDQSSFEFFCRGFSELGGNFSATLGNAMYAQYLLGAVHVVDFAYIKKLLWLVHKKRPCGDAALTACLSSEPNDCAICTAKLSKLGHLLYKGVSCEACQLVVCRKCSVVKKVPIDDPSSGQVVQKTLSFCVPCMIEAKEAPTEKVAVALMEIMPIWC